MKSLTPQPSYVLAILLTCGLAACKKTESAPDPQSQVSCEMVIDNAAVAFSSTNNNTTISRINGANAGISLSALNDKGNEVIKLLVYKTYDNTGRFALTHTFADSHAEILTDKNVTSVNNTYADYLTNSSNQYGDGYVDITKRDGNYIEGSFTLTAYNKAGKTATLKQGHFAGTIQ